MTDDEINERQRQLREQLAVAPVVDVVGVVAPRGAGGVRSGETLWSLQTGFEAWRVAGGELHMTPLPISRTVTDEELTRLMGQFEAYQVVRVRARVGETAFGGHQALLEEFVGPDATDAELVRHAEHLQQPVTFDDPQFGPFTLDREMDWFTAEAGWAGQPVTLTLSESEQAQEALATARALWADQADWDRRVRGFAVQELLPLKNGNWLDEDEDELDPDEFLDRMTLQSITVDADGGFEFWHDDGGLFCGHAIQVCGTLAEGPTDADIPG